MPPIKPSVPPSAAMGVGAGPVPVPDPSLPILAQPPLILLAMCGWGEARGQPTVAKAGQMAVVGNRKRFWRKEYGERTWAGIILRPHAFSCFLVTDPNYPKLVHPIKDGGADAAAWEEAYTLAYLLDNGSLTDTVFGATFYFDDSILTPSWATAKLEKVAKLGKLNFWRYPLNDPGF